MVLPFVTSLSHWTSHCSVFPSCLNAEKSCCLQVTCCPDSCNVQMIQSKALVALSLSHLQNLSHSSLSSSSHLFLVGFSILLKSGYCLQAKTQCPPRVHQVSCLLCYPYENTMAGGISASWSPQSPCSVYI